MSKQQKYIKTKKQGYLKDSTDAAQHPFSAFQIQDEIHIVYDLGTLDQHVSIELIETVQNNMDRYLWTPFIEFV